MKNHTIIDNPMHDEEYESCFWSVLEEFSEEDMSRFLEFVTGVGRPPINGFANMNPPVTSGEFTHIQLLIRFFPYAMKENETLPLALSHTCSNQITIPYYQSKEELKKYLLMSIYEAEGYGYS